ncbi:MAG: FAD-dependent oxidoreductase [Clostridia bacterium]|nr:FAD-dependent oxidoreductase [Clostridia bacterium]MBQ4543503.1 FAD-dependent oxidoreductase [Clostridia bacterium]MBQ9997709.1 FAD-dependent oxidoreductase [Clostridia bacterium]
MSKITLDVQKEYNCDVLVCGGGVSGFASAVSSARNGAKTILIENGGFLGGTATKGLVGPFMTCYDSKGKERIIKGLYFELEDRLVQAGGGISPEQCPGGNSYSGYRTKGHYGVMPFDTETAKIVFEQMCLEAGVQLLYHTTIIGCEKQGDKITCVYAADRNDIIKINGKMFIDTTGSASLANKAGAETMRGNDDGMLQTASLFFKITGVEKGTLDGYMSKNPEMRERFFMDVIEQGQKDGTFPCGTRKLRIYENPDGTWTVNMAQIDGQLNELDGEEITKGEISQRIQMGKIIEFLKSNIPGLSHIRLVTSASDIGLRESRRLVGKHILTLSDIENCTKFPDRIAVCANSIDIHQKNNVNYITHTGENYYIPLSCLISKNVSNLLTAGKSLSADKYAFGAVRVMPPCIAMGEAAGITAALASQSGISADEVPYEKVQEILIKNGGIID